MKTALANIASAQLVDNEIVLFYELSDCDVDFGPDLNLGCFVNETQTNTKVAGSILPLDQLDALHNRYKDTPIWKRLNTTEAAAPNWSVSQDLLPSIRELLSGARPELASQWGVTPIASNLINTMALYNEDTPLKERTNKRLALSIRNAGTERLKKAGIEVAPLMIKIHEISIASFTTGYSFCMTRIGLERLDKTAISTIELMEALYALSHNNNCNWVLSNTPKEKLGEKFSLGEFVRLFAQGSVPKGTRARRADTYVYGQLSTEHSTEELEAASAFLSRRYTIDYALDVDKASIEIIRDFSNIRHAISTEGAASLICKVPNGEQPNYLLNWKTNTFLSSYARLFLLSLHENAFLSKSRGETMLGNRNHDDIEILDSIIEKAMFFKFNFRFHSVSKLSVHNLFSKALRKSKQLEEKLQELEGDVSAVFERLSSARQLEAAAIDQNRHRNYSVYAVIGSSFLAGLTGFTIVDEILEIFPLISENTKPNLTTNELDVKYPVNISVLTDRGIAVLLGAGITLITAIIGICYLPKKAQKPSTRKLSYRTMALKIMKGSLR